MNISEIRERLDWIEYFSYDDEKAHLLADELYRDFVRHIAKHGTKTQKVMAKAILEAEEINFERWTA